MTAGTGPRRAVVVGAGSAGLACAAELAGRGLGVTVLEAGDRPGYRWSVRYRSLRLNTLRALSGMPGAPLSREHGPWVSATAFTEHLERFVGRHGLRVRTGVRALGVQRTPDERWTVTTDDAGELTADVLVVATGNADVPATPSWSERFDGAALHSSGYGGPEDVTGPAVLVVGSGNSAAEIATELAGHGLRVTLSVRTAPLLVPTTQLGVSTHRISVLGARLPDRLWDAAGLSAHRMRYGDLRRRGLGIPAVGSHTRFRGTGMAPVAERGLADAVRRGRVEVVPAAVGADGADVLLDGGAVRRPDTLLLATGFRPGFDRLLGDLGVLTPDGRPVAWAAPLPGAPGLFVAGAPSLQGDIREHGREARRIGRAVGLLGARRDDRVPR